MSGELNERMRSLLGIPSRRMRPLNCPTERPCHRIECDWHLIEIELLATRGDPLLLLRSRSGGRRVVLQLDDGPSGHALLARRVNEEIAQMRDTCAIDVSQRGETGTAEIAELLGISVREAERVLKAAIAAGERRAHSIIGDAEGG